jgi:hypothetical protein
MEKEHCQTHSMKPVLHSSQNQTRIKQQQKRESQATLCNELRCKNPHWNIGKLNWTAYKKRSYTMVKLVSFQGCKDGSAYTNHLM